MEIYKLKFVAQKKWGVKKIMQQKKSKRKEEYDAELN